MYQNRYGRCDDRENSMYEGKRTTVMKHTAESTYATFTFTERLALLREYLRLCLYSALYSNKWSIVFGQSYTKLHALSSAVPRLTWTNENRCRVSTVLVNSFPMLIAWKAIMLCTGWLLSRLCYRLVSVVITFLWHVAVGRQKMCWQTYEYI